MHELLSFLDLVIPPIFLAIIYLFAKRKQLNNIDTNPSYRYFLYGLGLKIFGGISVCLIYVYYYGYGDTLNYYNDCVTILNMAAKSPHAFLDYFTGPTQVFWSEVDDNTGSLVYGGDPRASAVVKLTWILCFLSFKSFIGMTILLAAISYWPIWRLYQVLIQEFPNLVYEFAFALLFMPSVFFWGSGLLKDTITFAAVCLFSSSYFIIIIKKKSILRNFLYIVLASYLMLWIKPYIYFALLPGSILWYGGIKLENVDNKLVKSLSTPFLIFFSMIAGYVMLSVMSGFLGDFSLDNVLDKAVTTQMDLKSDHYHGAAFDIGEFDPTVQGILKKVPAAINAALFRPYIWETYNLAMLLSGLENLFMLGFTLYLLIKLKVFNLFRLMFRHRILFFTVYFSLFFSFSVGLTTSNFGSLVRYKIPAIPFYLISLIIISSTYKDLLKEDHDMRLQKASPLR
jgi:hypothetical protein